MNRSPAFQFYPKDWMDFKVQRLSLQAMGAYINLLSFMWKDSDDQCSIPDNPSFIAKVLSIRSTSWQRLRCELQHPDARLFVEQDGKLISERLADEAQKQAEYRFGQSEAGKAGAAKRWQDHKGCHSNPIVSPLAENSSFSSSSSSNQTSSSEPSASPSVLDDASHLTNLLICKIKANLPTGRLSKPENEAKARRDWPRQFDLMIRKDNHSLPEIRALIEWTQANDFWRSNILSPGKLRDQWDTITLQMQRTKSISPLRQTERKDAEATLWEQ